MREPSVWFLDGERVVAVVRSGTENIEWSPATVDPVEGDSVMTGLSRSLSDTQRAYMFRDQVRYVRRKALCA